MDHATPYVYVIAAPEISLGRVKIGHTNNHPSERLAQLQTGSPTQLRLAYFTEGNQATERILHAYFAAYRVHGEWFEFGDRNPVAAVTDAVTLLRDAVEPYDPNRRMAMPADVDVDVAQQRYENRRDAITSALIVHGAMGTRQLSRVTGLPESSTRKAVGRMSGEGIVYAGQADRHGAPVPLFLNTDHPVVLAMLV